MRDGKTGPGRWVRTRQSHRREERRGRRPKEAARVGRWETAGDPSEGVSGRSLWTWKPLLCACGRQCPALAPCHGHILCSLVPTRFNVSLSFSDQVFPPTCSIGKNFLSLNYLAEYLQPKPAEGCVVSGRPQEKEVHIIELIAPNSNPYRWVTVCCLRAFSELTGGKSKDLGGPGETLAQPALGAREGASKALGSFTQALRKGVRSQGMCYCCLCL